MSLVVDLDDEGRVCGIVGVASAGEVKRLGLVKASLLSCVRKEVKDNALG